MRFGLQLYGVAGECRSNPADFFRQIRELGYRQIEPCIAFESGKDLSGAQNTGRTGDGSAGALEASGTVSRNFSIWNEDEADAFLAEAEKAGLKAPSIHAFTGELGRDAGKIRDFAVRHYITQIILPCPEVADRGRLAAFAQTCVETAEVLGACGIRLLLHNGVDEIVEKIEGRTAYEWLLDACKGKVGAQPDVGWLYCGGEDPEAFLWRNESRVWSLHYKDVTAQESHLGGKGPGMGKPDGTGSAGRLPEAVFGSGSVDLTACFQFARAHGISQIVDIDGIEAVETMDGIGRAVSFLGGLTQCRENTESILCSIDASTGELEQLHTYPFVIEAPNWLNDGTMYFNSEGRIFHYDPETDRTEAVNTGACVHCNNDHVPSPDNRLLAVSENGAEGWDSHIYIVNPQTGETRLVTQNSPSYLHGWSSDGEELAYCAFREHGDGRGKTVDIYTISAADCGKQAEVRRTSGEGFNDGPEYSPDGKHIWFNSTRTGLMQVWRMNRNGSNPQQMTFDEANNWFGHVSPDGEKVAFLTYRKDDLDPEEHLPNTQVKLRLMDYDGSGVRTLLEFFGGQGSVNVNSWSPDSRRIALVIYRLRHK